MTMFVADAANNPPFPETALTTSSFVSRNAVPSRSREAWPVLKFGVDSLWIYGQCLLDGGDRCSGSPAEYRQVGPECELGNVRSVSRFGNRLDVQLIADDVSMGNQRFMS